MQTGCATLYESDDRCGAQTRQLHLSTTKLIREEIPNERDIVDDRCLRQSAILPQVPLVTLRTAFGWDEWRRRDFLRRNRSPITQKRNEITERGGISWSGLPLTMSIS
jgi:hypothetical protein